ncbi:MAG: alpha/beta hydrolase [Candidatus Nitrospinota bacterium M3_3B_026]
MSKTLLLLALIVVLAALSARAYVKIMEPRYLFHPRTALEMNPAMAGMEFRDVYIESGGNTLHGWYIPHDDAVCFIIFYHGNVGNIADRIDFLKILKNLRAHVLIFDYRGYGMSEGVPTIEGIEEDAVAALEWLTMKVGAPRERVILWGKSLGGAAALAAARRYPDVAGVVVESAFSTYRRLAHEVAPLAPVVFITDAFRNEEILSRIKTPKLIIHGLADELIPFHHAERLYDKAAEPKRILPVRGAGHGDTHTKGGQAYLDAAGQWLMESLARAANNSGQDK